MVGLDPTIPATGTPWRWILGSSPRMTSVRRERFPGIHTLK
jgi:hypothetical protein